MFQHPNSNAMSANKWNEVFVMGRKIELKWNDEKYSNKNYKKERKGGKKWFNSF